jgi:branched-chain amino acid transport system permease protein
LYAQYISYIDATADPGAVLSPSVGLDAIICGLLGGMGTVVGPLVGAIVRIGVGECLRIVYGWTGGLDLAIFGAISILCILFLRGGIWGFVRDRIRARRVQLGVT